MKKNLLLTLLFFFFLKTISGQFSGTYTIDPGQPASATNYISITAALEDLTNGVRPDGGPVNGFGVSGPVIFNIADGDYNEALQLTPVFNSDLTNTITFQSASGDSTSVRIFYTPDDESNYSVVYFNNADYFILKHLTIEAISGYSSAYAVRLQNSCQYNTITNCVLQGVPTSSTSTSYSTIYHYGSGCDDNQYLNNLVLDGSFGMHIYYGHRNIVKGNQFKNHYSYGLYMRRNTESKILSNTFTEPDNYNYYAMYLYQNYDSTHVIGNVINGDYYIGIYMRYTYATASEPAIVANNMIYLGDISNQKYGIYCYYSDYVHFYYNSINLTNNNNGARCFHQYSGTTNSIRLQNNNFVSKYGPAIFINTSGAIEYSDNNNFYSENFNLGYWDGWRSDLANWQSASGEDGNSISVNPKFFSNADLHTYDKALDSLGNPNSVVLTDIDGENRDPVNSDIGADEFTRLTIDAELVSIDSLESPICGGSHDIYITIFNNGLDTLTSLDITTELNDDPAVTYSWSGSLLSDSSTSVNIGSFNFDIYTEQSLSIYCDNPNATIDTNASNDSVYLDFTTTLSGTYTLGGTDPDFEDFDDVFDALSEFGVCGDVVINIRDSIFEDHIVINEIPGANESSTVTFRSESGDNSAVTIRSDISDYALLFNGADFVTFELITIEQMYSGNVVEFRNSANNNQLLNCVLDGSDTQSTSNNYAVIYSQDSYLKDSNLFKNNQILDGSYGIYYRGVNTGTLASNVQIEDNVFRNQYYMGIYLQYHNAPIVNNNYISSNTYYSNFYGIFMTYCDNDFEVTNNEVFKTYTGIRIEYCDASNGNESLIANNYVHTKGNGSTYGINLYNSSYLNIYYNSVNDMGLSTGSAAFLSSAGSNMQVLNNIFATDNGNAYYIGTAAAIDSSEHNNYFTCGEFLAYWNGYRTDLASLRSANSMDVNSNSVSPDFVSDTNLLISNIALNNMGIPLAEVTTDITGAARHATTPDIGAIEFDVSGTLDATVVDIATDATPPLCADYYDFYALLVNNSADTLFTCNLEWELNGTAQTAVAFDDTLLSGEKIYLLVDSILFAEGQDYNLVVWSDSPNGGTDDRPENDTARASFYAALNGTYTLGGSSPDFEDFTELANHLNFGGLCGPSTVNVRDGVYNEQIAIYSIYGSSAANHLTIQSESGVSDNVVLEWESESSIYNYTLGLYNTDHISINNITIKALGDKYGTALAFTNNDSLLLTGNTFINENDVTEDNYLLNLVYSVNNNGDDKQFVGNKFIGGNYAFYLDGSGTVTGTRIHQNQISNSFYGLYINDDYSTEISENTIHSKVLGIHLNYIYDDFTISKNKIVVEGINNNYDVYGMRVHYCNGDTALISNNFISNTSMNDVSTYGIYLYSSYDVQLLYNNIRISNPNSFNPALYIYSGNGHNIQNNILANFGEGYSLYANGNYSSLVDTSDFNNYFTQGDYPFYSNGYKISTTKLLRFVTGNNELDSNSVMIDPVFNSATDLHVNEISLNALANPVKLIPDDIDGDTRNLVTPDIGADEFDVMGVDAAISYVETSEDFLCDGEYSIQAIIRNLGQTTLTSCSVNWSVDGAAQTAISWTGSLTSGQNSDTITIGTYSFTASDKEPFELKAWTSSPNGTADEKPANDSSLAYLYPGVSGTFTVGYNGTEDFASLREVNDFLMNSGGVCGPVIFNLSDGIYEEYLEIYEIKGVSDSNTVTFQSASGDASAVKIIYNVGYNYDAVIAIFGGDHLVFNNLTIEQTNNNDYCFQFENGASNNVISNCVLVISDNGEGVYSDNEYDNPDNNNSFTYNKFIGGDYGIYWYGWNDDDVTETGIIIANNEFINQDNYAIYVEYCDSAILKDNYIVNTVEATGYNYGIYLYQEYTSGYFEITGNEIIMNEGDYGISVEYARGASMAPSLLANNMVVINTQQSSVYGLYIYESANINILHNSINIINAPNNSYTFYIEYGANINVLNNIFVNNAGGYAYYYDWPTYAIAQSDYNNIYSSGSTPFYHDNYGSITDLSAWNGFTGLDANSYDLMPNFTTQNDLHLCDTALDNKGVSTGILFTDIDHQTRDASTPDIGADEYTALSNINLGGTLSLCDEPLILDAGPFNGTYLWSTGETTQTISVTSTGNYSVTITSGCGSVTDDVDVVESIDIPTADFTYEISFLTAAFTNTSSNANSYIWDFGDGNTSSEMSPIHLFSSEGSYTVSLKAVNSCSKDSVESVITIDVDTQKVHLEESDFAQMIEIYPNPNNGLFQIEFTFESDKNVELQVFDISGSLVYSDIYSRITYNNIQIDISNYPKGNYNIVLRIDDEYVTHKIIIE